MQTSLTYKELLDVLNSFDEQQLQKPVLIHLKDSEYLHQGQEVILDQEDNTPVILGELYVHFEEE